MRMFTTLAIAAAALGLATSVQGAVTPLSFDIAASGPTDSKLVYFGKDQDVGSIWEVTGGTVDVVLPGYHWALPSGMTNAVDLIGTPNKFTGAQSSVNGLGSIAHIAETVQDSGYKLTFDYAFNPEFIADLNIDERSIRKRLVVEIYGPEATEPMSFWKSEYSNLAGKTTLDWLSHELVFTASANATRIVMRAEVDTSTLPSGVGVGALYNGPVVGNITLALIEQPSGTPVPEPASVGVLGAAGMLLLRRGRRRG